MADGRGRRDILQTLDDSELMKRYRLDRAGITIVVDLIRDALTSPTQRHNALPPKMKVITTLRYLATGKMQQCSSDDLGLSQPSTSCSLVCGRFESQPTLLLIGWSAITDIDES